MKRIIFIKICNLEYPGGTYNSGFHNPSGSNEKEDSALEILKILKNYPLDGIVQKTFYDIRHV